MAKKKEKSERPLTEKQERFCQFYLDCDGNASAAYRMAYNTENMSDEAIYVKATELKKDGKITVRINEIREQRSAESKLDKEKVMGQLLDIVMANPNDLYTVDPVSGKVKMRTPNQLPKRVRNAIKKIRNNRGVIEYEFHGKVEAARLLSSLNGWDAPQKVDVSSHGLKLSGINFNLPKKE